MDTPSYNEEISGLIFDWKAVRDHSYIRFYNDTQDFMFNVDLSTFEFKRSILNSLISVYRSGVQASRNSLHTG
jgi:hypothetical protein